MANYLPVRGLLSSTFETLFMHQPGDILTFDNRRMLHGRGSFLLTEDSGRHLELGYLEWDEINSRLRVLAMECANPTTDLSSLPKSEG